jgi:hypothetical protein
MTSPEDQAAEALGQVVEIGSSAREADLGAAVMRHVAGRSGPRGGGSPDPAPVASPPAPNPGVSVVVDYNALEAKHGPTEALNILGKLRTMFT